MLTRVNALLVALGVYLAGLAICGALLTVRNLYAGEALLPSGDPVTGMASVGECVRSGPVSSYGFGYWWDCDVTITLPDGRQSTTTLGRSMVTPADRDRPVPVVGHCTGTEQAECSFARGRNVFLALLGWFAGVLVAVSLVVTAVIGGSALLVAVLGPDLTERWFGRWSRQPAASGEPAPPVEPPAPLPAGTGGLRVRFDFPAQLAPLYEQARPRLLVDGDDVAITDRSPRTCALPPGPHRIRVSTVLSGGMVIGTVQQTVEVHDGVETIVGYEAPGTLAGLGVLRIGLADENADVEPAGPRFQLSFARLLLAVVPLNLVLFCLLSDLL